MPVPDQVRDDGSGTQNILKLLDSGVRRNDGPSRFRTFYETVHIEQKKGAGKIPAPIIKSQ